VAEADKIVVAVYAYPPPGNGSQDQWRGAELGFSAEESANLLRKILQAEPGKTLVMADGNPYLAKDFPGVQIIFVLFPRRRFRNSAVRHCSAR